MLALFAAAVTSVAEPDVHVTAPWLVTQLVPSPEIAVGSDGALFGLRWQVTPVLWSFGIDRRLSPWRFFVVEPLVRHSGSVELFGAPEYLGRSGGIGRRFGARVGLRSYFALLEKGEALSISVGTSWARFADVESASYEAGAYFLFGFVGLESAFVPGFDEARWIGTLRLRFF